jgi:hypothetical protein
MSISINGTNGVTFNDGSLQKTSAQTGFRNRIINGDMRIDQRNAGASVTPTNGQYLVDRWFGYQTFSSQYSAQQTTTAPAGFVNSLKATSLSAYSIVATDVYTLGQVIEGLNIADLAWGTASAATVTLSFKVYSSLTGTFGGSLQNSAKNRTYPFSYSVPTANTWTTISVTIAGDTTGTWATNNTIGIYVLFGLGVGSTYSGTAGAWSANSYYSATGAVSVVGTNGATFYITGVQLEAGSTATEFERRPYGTELALCQRYYEQVGGNTGDLNAIALKGYQLVGSYLANQYMFPVQKRVAPTATVSGTFTVVNCGQPFVLNSDTKTWSFQTLVSATGAIVLYSNNSGLITFSAELL